MQILETIKTLFNQENKKSDIDAPELEGNPNFLTDPIQINKLLKNIEDASPLCTITFEDTDEEFSSSILDVQIDSQHIILDELIPPHGNELLIKKDKLKLSTIYHGIRLAFSLSKLTEGASRNIAFYKTKIPSRVYYPQRRSSPRTQISNLSIVFSGISSKTHATVGGTLFDLSRTGIGINASSNTARFQRGDIIKNCKITLDEYSLDFHITIRFVKKSSDGTGKTLVGGYFENISSKSQKKLEHFVASLEREEIRKRKA